MKGLAKAFALFTGASMIGSLTQVIKGKITTVLLGTEGVGVLNQLTNLWSLFSVAASLGFYNGMVRHLAPAWNDKELVVFRRHMSSSALVMMASAFLLSLVGCIFSSELSELVFADKGTNADLICMILISIPIYIGGLTYRAMLTASRSVNALVRARIGADILSVLVLAALIFPFGLKGAIMGYIGLHLLYLCFTAAFVWKVLGSNVYLPSPRLFSTTELSKNIGFGLNGLIVSSTGIITSLIVGRWIIATLGTGDNGLFAMALKVGTVYLGGLSAAAGGFYFPMLASTKTKAELHGVINQTLSMYLFFIPPIIVVLMVGGELMMLLLFSSAFMPAAVLLLIILPADIFRIIAETISMALDVKNRLIISTSSYIIWAIVYLGLVAVLIPEFGIIGVALAYFLSQAFNAAQQVILGWFTISYRFDSATLGTILRGFGIVVLMALTIFSGQPYWINWLVALLLLTIWTALGWSNPDFRNFVRKALSRIGLNLPKKEL